MVLRTVVTREPEWDDTTRARAIAHVEHEQSIDLQTGLPTSEAFKPQKFMVEDVTNYAVAAIDRQRRIDEADAKKQHLDDGWDAGRRYVVRPATPEEIEEAERGH